MHFKNCIHHNVGNHWYLISGDLKTREVISGLVFVWHQFLDNLIDFVPLHNADRTPLLSINRRGRPRALQPTPVACSSWILGISPRPFVDYNQHINAGSAIVSVIKTVLQPITLTFDLFQMSNREPVYSLAGALFHSEHRRASLVHFTDHFLKGVPCNVFSAINNIKLLCHCEDKRSNYGHVGVGVARKATSTVWTARGAYCLRTLDMLFVRQHVWDHVFV